MLLTRVDALLRAEHLRLAPDDECYFLREYIPRRGWKGGATNSLIANLKKSPSRRGRPDWHYKDQAIRTAAAELRDAINRAWLDGAVLVPMPPSKDVNDPEYDDRMFLVASQVAIGTQASVSQLLRQRAGTGAYHHSESARDVAPIIANMFVDYPRGRPPPARIGVLDDVLTTGAHFRAARHVLGQRFPAAHIVGFFIARRIIVEDDDQGV